MAKLFFQKFKIENAVKSTILRFISFTYAMSKVD